jgi:CubicO group peptidase (beta-lactamase class C family)
MNDTSYTARDWFAGRLAIPQGPKDEAEPKVRTTWCAADMLRTTIGDYSKFLVSVMHNENVTKEIATERLTITRNLVTPDQQTKVCAQAKLDLASCNVIAGLGLGWQTNQINHDTIIDHSGSDWGVHTHVFFLPQHQVGVVIFTNGDNGENVIREIVAMIYPNPIYLAHLGP